MSDAIMWMRTFVAVRCQRLRRTRHDDLGASVVETVIIAAGLAVLALSVMAAIKLLVDEKVAGIRL
jgi:Flp pilus assembly protein TadG